MKVKQILKFAKNEFIYGGHLISLGAVSIVTTSAILLDIKITWDFLVIVYLIVYIIYLYDRFIGFKQDSLANFNRSRHIRKYIEYIPMMVTISILVIIGILFYFGNQVSLIFGLLLLFFGLCYNLFFKKITQKIVGFKNIYVSFEWSLMVIFLVVYYSFSINLSVLLIFSFIFLRLLLHEIFFDIKDIENDKKECLLTIPIILKKHEVLNILNLLNILTALVIVFGVYLNLFLKSTLMLLPLIAFSFCYFKKLKKTGTKFSYIDNIIIDGEYILWTIFILIGNLV